MLAQRPTLQRTGAVGLAVRSSHVQRPRRALSGKVISLLQKGPFQNAPRRTSVSSSQKLPLFNLISAEIEVNAAVHTFEVLAGRSAMISFLLAAAVEAMSPHGLFSGWDTHTFNWFVSTAVLLMTCSAGLATVSKKQLGSEFREQVLTSLTAISRSTGSAVEKSTDAAVNHVLQRVFLDANLLDLEDFI